MTAELQIAIESVTEDIFKIIKERSLQLWYLTFTCSKLTIETIETLENRCEICSKLTTKVPGRRQGRRSGIFIVNIEYISHLFPLFLSLTLNK